MIERILDKYFEKKLKDMIEAYMLGYGIRYDSKIETTNQYGRTLEIKIKDKRFKDCEYKAIFGIQDIAIPTAIANPEEWKKGIDAGVTIYRKEIKEEII